MRFASLVLLALVAAEAVSQGQGCPPTSGRGGCDGRPAGAINGGVTTLVFAGSRSELAEMPPRSARVIAEAGQRALAAVGGLAAFAGCPGLRNEVVIAGE